MVERSFSMREVLGSMPGFSTFFFFENYLCVFFLLFLANSSDNKQVFRWKIVDSPFQIPRIKNFAMFGSNLLGHA